jgi:hypothetical protein
LSVKKHWVSIRRKQQLALCVGIISVIRKVVVFQSRIDDDVDDDDDDDGALCIMLNYIFYSI